MKLGMLTTWETRCGIAAYTKDLVTALRSLPGVEIEIVPIDAGIRSGEHYREQARILNACDIVHIQHEYSFWGGYIPGKNRYHMLRREIMRPVVLTAHTTTDVETLLVLPEAPQNASPGAQMRVKYRRVRMRTLLPLLLKTGAYRRWLEVSPFATSDQVIVHTEEARQTLIERGIERTRIHVLTAGISSPAPTPSGERDFKRRFGLQDRRLLVIFGYVTPHKGYELMLDVMPKLPADVQLVIAGGARTELEAPYIRELQGKISAAGLTERVTLTGFLPEEDLGAVMAAAEIVAVPHTQATGSYSVTLPISYGKPIVASDLPCFREIHERVPSMLTFPSGNAESLLGAVNNLLSDEGLRRQVSTEIRDFAASNSWESVARRTMSIYELALQPQKRPG